MRPFRFGENRHITTEGIPAANEFQGAQSSQSMAGFATLVEPSPTSYHAVLEACLGNPRLASVSS
jgi:hypothetical protein